MSLKKYGIYAEDPPFKSFLEVILPRLLNEIDNETKLLLDNRFSTDKKPKDGISNFLRTFTDAITEGCLDESDGGYGLQFCVLGLDCDENDLLELQQNIKNTLAESNQINFAVICIAQKSIEFWMWYCKAEKGLLSIEPIYDLYNNQTMKPLIYNRKRSGSRGIAIAENLAESVNILYLRQNSQSFEAFYQELKTFVEK